MKISFKSGSNKFLFFLPDFLIFSSLGAAFLTSGAKKYGGDSASVVITGKTMRMMRRSIRKMKKIHKNWNLVEVKSADGDNVLITL